MILALGVQVGFAHNMMAAQMPGGDIRVVLCTGDGPLVAWVGEDGTLTTDTPDGPGDREAAHKPCQQLTVVAFAAPKRVDLVARVVAFHRLSYAWLHQAETTYHFARSGLTRAPPALT